MKNKTAYRKKPEFSKPDRDKNMGRDKAGLSLSSSGRVLPPLAGRRSPSDEFLEIGIALFGQLCSFNQLAFMSGVRCIGGVSGLFSARFFIFCDVGSGVCFQSLYSSGLVRFLGTFAKRRSSLGRFSSRSVALL